MFVCESPSNWPGRGESVEPYPCFYSSYRDKRFQVIREEFGFGDCYITNSVKCGPRRDDAHSADEARACRGFLLREIELVKPKVVVAVGGHSKEIVSRFVLPYAKSSPKFFTVSHYSRRVGDEEMLEIWRPQFKELTDILEYHGWL